MSYNSYTRVLGCSVHDIPNVANDSEGGSAIDFYNFGPCRGEATGNVICRIGNLSSGNNHCQGIYIAGPGCVIRNNIVSNVQAYGIHMWHGATGATISNNLVFECHRGGVRVGSGDSGATTCQNVIVSNNILIRNYGNGGIYEQGNIGSKNRYLNNLVWNNSGGSIKVDPRSTVSGTINQDPLLVNYQANGSGDYHLTSGSPCIDRGTSTGDPATGYADGPRPQGTGYDIGPYERVPRH